MKNFFNMDLFDSFVVNPLDKAIYYALLDDGLERGVITEEQFNALKDFQFYNLLAEFVTTGQIGLYKSTMKIIGRVLIANTRITSSERKRVEAHWENVLDDAW